MAIVVRLDEQLHARRMTLTELAARIDITLANLSILKTGKARAIRFSTLDAICAALNCQPGDILQFREEVRVEFSEMREGLRSEMRELHTQAIARIALTEQALLHEMGQLDERAASRAAETRRMMQPQDGAASAVVLNKALAEVQKSRPAASRPRDTA